MKAKGISLQRHFPRAAPELLQLFSNAADCGLDAVDFYTIKDLQHLSGCSDDELAALLACVFLSLREGSVCLEISSDALLRRMDGILDKEKASGCVKKIIAGLESERFSSLIARDGKPETVDEPKPLVLRERGGRTLLYFQKYLRHEDVLRDLLLKRLGAQAPKQNLKPLRSLLQETLRANENAGISFIDDHDIGIDRILAVVIEPAARGTVAEKPVNRARTQRRHHQCRQIADP